MKQPIEKIKDDLYVKKSFGEWIIVRPIKKDLNNPSLKNNINWKNLLIGSWGDLIKTLIFFGLIVFLIWSYKQDMQSCTEVLSSPCVQQCQSNDLKLPANYSVFGVINNERKNYEGIDTG